MGEARRTAVETLRLGTNEFFQLASATLLLLELCLGLEALLLCNSKREQSASRRGGSEARA